MTVHPVRLASKAHGRVGARGARVDRPHLPRRVDHAARELVEALRAELAAVEPGRACCRAGRASGPRHGRHRPGAGPGRGTSRHPPRAHGAPGRHALRPGRVPVRPLPPGLVARPVPGARIAQPGGRRAPTSSSSCPGDETAPAFGDHLAQLGLPASVRTRRGAGVVTWKSAASVSRFLRLTGASATVLELESRTVSRELRSDLIRQLNAETANLRRGIASGVRQAGAVAALQASGGFDGLPPPSVPSAAPARWHRRRPSATWRRAKPESLERPAGVAAHRVGRSPHAMIRAMRPIIIAGNWKMNSSAGRGWAARDQPGRGHGRRRPSSGSSARPPSACRWSQQLWPALAWPSAPRTSTRSPVAPTPARSRRPWSRLRDLGHRRALRAPPRSGRDRRDHRPQAHPLPRARPAADPLRRRDPRGARGGPAESVVRSQLAGALDVLEPDRRAMPPRGWSSPTSLSGPSAPGGPRPAPMPRGWPT